MILNSCGGLVFILVPFLTITSFTCVSMLRCLNRIAIIIIIITEPEAACDLLHVTSNSLVYSGYIKINGVDDFDYNYYAQLNSNPSHPYLIAISTLFLNCCSLEYSVSLSVLKQVAA